MNLDVQVAIPKRLGHIWIGDRNPPLNWMATWREHHPTWEYTLFDNAYLTSRRWQTQPLIIEYFKKRRFEGVADLMRYEILHEFGGFLPPADSICLKPTDALFTLPTVYSVYENETLKPGNMSPFLASVPKHPTVSFVIGQIVHKYIKKSKPLLAPWKSVGNVFLRKKLAQSQAEVHIFPSHYFVPQFKNDSTPVNLENSYANQLWGTTKNLYEETPEEERVKVFEETLEKLRSWL